MGITLADSAASTEPCGRGIRVVRRSSIPSLCNVRNRNFNELPLDTLTNCELLSGCHYKLLPRGLRRPYNIEVLLVETGDHSSSAIVFYCCVEDKRTK